MIWIIMAVLVAVGFVFPPAWLVVAGYAIYFYASRESRRNRAIESRVQAMVAARTDFAVFPELFYEAARAYSVSKGSNSSDHTGAGTTILVNGHPYSVAFSPAAGPRGGTAISIRDAIEIDREFEEFAARARSGLPHA